MKIRRKTRKRGGGPREKLFAWFDYVLDDANKNGWKKFSIIEKHTSKNGTIVKNIVEMEGSIMRSGRHVFPSTDMPMNKKYVTGLAMYLWDPQNNTGANYALYQRFESQYRNESSVPRSHSPVRGRNITSLRQQLDVVEEKLDSISSSVSPYPPVRQPIPNMITQINNQAPSKRKSLSNIGIQTNIVIEKLKNESNNALNWDKHIHGIEVLLGDWYECLLIFFRYKA